MAYILSGIILTTALMLGTLSEWQPFLEVLNHFCLQSRAAFFICAFFLVSAILASKTGMVQTAPATCRKKR